MPKKTKKEKIIAEYRKKLKLLQMSNIPSSSPIAVMQGKKTSSVQPTIKQPQIFSQEDNVIAKYFTQDLKKSLLLITGIIALEILLYFVSINNILRLIR